jgi:predicted transcriptional regulator
MSSTDVERLEALLISLRDQVDLLSERVERQLSEHYRGLHRLEADFVELELSVRSLGLDGPPGRAQAAR